jgi:hypothetical protein
VRTAIHIATGWLALALLASAGCESGGARWTFGSSSSEEDVWAVRCITLQGPDRFERAKQYAQALRGVQGLRHNLVQVIETEDGTGVFYGRYRRVYGGSEETVRYAPDPRRDIDLIRALRFQDQNVWPFILATMDVLPTYSSPHPEWNLAAQEEGYWALHVAVFYNTNAFRSRRSAAEEYCRVLREQGEPAYYHHGTVHSSVYVGLYPRGAVQTVHREFPMSNKIETSMVIADAEMQAAQKRFPHSLHNGHMRYDVRHDPKTGKVAERVPTPSFAVRTPLGQRLYEQDGRD